MSGTNNILIFESFCTFQIVAVVCRLFCCCFLFCFLFYSVRLCFVLFFYFLYGTDRDLNFVCSNTCRSLIIVSVLAIECVRLCVCDLIPVVCNFKQIIIIRWQPKGMAHRHHTCKLKCTYTAPAPITLVGGVRHVPHRLASPVIVTMHERRSKSALSADNNSHRIIQTAQNNNNNKKNVWRDLFEIIVLHRQQSGEQHTRQEVFYSSDLMLHLKAIRLLCVCALRQEPKKKW